MIPDHVTRLIIKDLVEGDGSKVQVELLKRKLDLTEQKLIGSDAIIANLNRQIENLKLVEDSRKEQIVNYESLSKALEKDLKLQKTKTKIYQSTTGAGLLLVLFLGVL